jgi:hypothetical protein
MHRIDHDLQQISNVCNTFISMKSVEDSVKDCLRLTDKSFVVM